MLCPAENGRKKKIFFFQHDHLLTEVDLIYKAGKNYYTYRNHSKVSVISYFKKNAV